MSYELHRSEIVARGSRYVESLCSTLKNDCLVRLFGEDNRDVERYDEEDDDPLSPSPIVSPDSKASLERDG